MMLFILGIVAGIMALALLCHLCPREKHGKGISVVLGNVTSDHRIEVTFRKKGGR